MDPGKSHQEGCLTFGATLGLKLQFEEWIQEWFGFEVYVQGEGHISCKACIKDNGTYSPWDCKGELRSRLGLKWGSINYESLESSALWD